MPRGDRSLLAPAIFGLVVTCFGLGALSTEWASPPSPSQHKNDASAQRYKAATVKGDYAAYPVINAERCYQANNHDSADLCAQWRAAIAAEKAADSALWGNWIALFGAVLSFASIVLVVVALRQGRDSLDHARESSRAELRAYLASDAERIERVPKMDDDDVVSYRVSIQLTNAGATPATGCILGCELWLQQIDGKGEHYQLFSEDRSMAAVPPRSRYEYQPFIQLLHDELDGLKSGQLELSGYIAVNFQDAFGAHWRYVQDLRADWDAVADGVLETTDCYQAKLD